MASIEMIDVLKRLRELDEKNPNVHTDAIANTEKANGVKEAKKAKPDFLDVDKDGNKKEPMKKAIKDKEKKKTNEAIQITADSPEDLPMLQRIMALAGMQKVSPDMMPQDDAQMVSMKPYDSINGSPCGGEYENEPDVHNGDVADITTLAGLNGLNGSKHPKDIRVKDPSPYEDAEEGYANSMGDEKEGERYDDEELEQTYGKTEIKKLPRKFSMRGDNPLEGLEERLKGEWVNFVNEKKLSKSEEKTKEKYVKGMKKAKGDFKDRYGKDAEAVMYATATKMAKKNS